MRARQLSTATYAIDIYMVSSTDHVTPQTGKTVTVTLSKNGGAFGAASGAVTEISSGHYKLAGNATDTNTLGSLVLLATASGCDNYQAEYDVITVDPFGANFGISSVTLAANQAVNATQLAGQTITAAAGVTFPTSVASPTNITAGTITTVGTLTTYTGNTPQTGDVFARLGVAGVGLTNLGDTRIANLDATISSRTKPADTQAAVTLVTTTTNLTNAPPDSSGVTTLLARLGAFTGSGVNTVLGFLKAALSKTGTLPSDIGGTFDPATDSNEAIRDRGDAAWTSGSGDPWLTLLPGSYASGTAGNELGNLQAQLAASGVTVVSPVTAAGNITLEGGDDYFSADGRALSWTSTSWPSLSGATIKFNARGQSITGSASGTTATVELTATQTAAFGGGVSPFEIEATLSGGHVVTLVRATLNVNVDVAGAT